MLLYNSMALTSMTRRLIGKRLKFTTVCSAIHSTVQYCRKPDVIKKRLTRLRGGKCLDLGAEWCALQSENVKKSIRMGIKVLKIVGQVNCLFNGPPHRKK